MIKCRVKNKKIADEIRNSFIKYSDELEITIEEGAQLLKDIIRDRDELDFNGEDNRALRRSVSQLSKEGIIFVAVGNWKYKRIERCTETERDAYIASRISALRTEYFNRIVPIKKYMKKEHLALLHEGGLFDEDKCTDCRVPRKHGADYCTNCGKQFKGEGNDRN